MYFDFIKHQNTNSSTLESIIRLKNQVWDYPYDAHKEWLKSNITDDDVHLLLWSENELIGYLNLVKISGSLKGWGIGNVVVSPKRQDENIGLLLMNLCDYYLAATHLPGMLICKDKVLGFYIRCGWSIYNKEVYIKNEKLPYNFLTRRLDNNMFEYIKIDRIF